MEVSVLGRVNVDGIRAFNMCLQKGGKVSRDLLSRFALIAVITIGCSQNAGPPELQSKPADHVFTKGWFKLDELGENAIGHLTVFVDKQARIEFRLIGDIPPNSLRHKPISARICFPYNQNFSLEYVAGNVWRTGLLPSQADAFLRPAIYQKYEIDLPVGENGNVERIALIFHSNPVARVDNQSDEATVIECHGGRGFPEQLMGSKWILNGNKSVPRFRNGKTISGEDVGESDTP